MDDLAEFVGRLLAILVTNGVLSHNDTDYILGNIDIEEWMKNAQNKTSE